MRGSVQDMMTSGWELAPIQSLVGVDPDLMAQREKEFFVCVDGAIFSKDFAVKAQAMKTVSLGQVSLSLLLLNELKLNYIVSSLMRLLRPIQVV